MNTTVVTVVRIYLTERQHLLDALLTQLHDQEKVKGATVFRGLSGFGGSGTMHSPGLVDLSFDQPLVVEFFDLPERAKEIMAHLSRHLKPGHMIFFEARMVV